MTLTTDTNPQRISLAHRDPMRRLRTVRLTVARDTVSLVKATDAQLVAAAREWIADCYWTDVDAEEFDALPDAVIVRGVQRHYANGLAGFAADYLY